MQKVTISEKGQISIPILLRRRYGLKKGDKLAVEENDGAIILRPLPRNPILSLRGMYRSEEREKLTDLLLKERRVERKQEKY